MGEKIFGIPVIYKLWFDSMEETQEYIDEKYAGFEPAKAEL